MSRTPEFPTQNDYVVPWSPGRVKRLPWLGLEALVGAILALGASVAILVVSNGQPISSWKIQPSVYLAIAVPIINILLAFALSVGVEIAFWRKATASGSTVADLHRVWQFGTSFKEAVLAGKRTNLIAIACILVVTVQINSPLLQRASKVVENGIASSSTIDLQSSLTLPATYHTGYQSGRGGGIMLATLYTSSYVPIVNDWLSSKNHTINYSHGCTGVCRTRMRGLGLSVNCTVSSANFDLMPQSLPNGTYDASSDVSFQGTDVFLATVNDGGNYMIALASLYKATSDCKGTFNMQQCMLTPATVEYPVLVDGNKSTISLDPASTIWGDRVLTELSDPYLSSSAAGPTSKTGILLALLNRYNSSAHIRFAGGVGYEVRTVGPTAQSYVQPTDSAATCNLSFRNPMDDMIAGARDLVFRTGLAVAEANSSFATIQSLQAQQLARQAVFHSDYSYIAAAVALTLLAMIPVVLVFRGYSHFGRECSLSPIAIAHAFDAPLLRVKDSNLPIDQLVENVGNRSVRYGAVRVDAHVHSGTPLTSRYKESRYNVETQEVDGYEASRLCFADEDVVTKPYCGQTFVG